MKGHRGLFMHDPQSSRRRSGWHHHGLRWIALVGLVLLFTGLALQAWPAERVPELSERGRDARHLARSLHGLTAWWLCALTGRSIWPHVRLVLARASRDTHWVLGMSLGSVLALLALSGLLLLYGPVSTLEWTLKLHWWLGLAVPLLLLAHVLWSRRSRARNPAQNQVQGRAQRQPQHQPQHQPQKP